MTGNDLLTDRDSILSSIQIFHFATAEVFAVEDPAHRLLPPAIHHGRVGVRSPSAFNACVRYHPLFLLGSSMVLNGSLVPRHRFIISPHAKEDPQRNVRTASSGGHAKRTRGPVVPIPRVTKRLESPLVAMPWMYFFPYFTETGA